MIQIKCLLVILALYLESSSPREMTVDIFEESEVGQIIFNISKAYNQNSLDFSNYQIFNSRLASQFFAVHSSQHGTIEIKQRVDRDVFCEEYKICCHYDDCRMPVNIRKDDEYSEVITLTINIIDINDNRPRWNQPEIVDNKIRLEILESTKRGKIFDLPRANDKDIGVNSQLTYSIEPKGIFHLNWSVDDLNEPLKLILFDELDREVTDQLTVSIIAKDFGHPQLTGSLDVQILVMDINDNEPKFEHDSYSIEVYENHTVFSNVLDINATDLDNGKNAMLVYSFPRDADQETARKFDIYNGSLILRESLDYESRKEYNFIVEVRDMGYTPKTATTNVQIKVLDSNDNSPEIIFEENQMYYSILENENRKKIITFFTVSDRDENGNQEVNCSLITKGNENLLLSNSSIKLERISRPPSSVYKIVAEHPLDREQYDSYKLTISCHDTATPIRKIEKTIHLQVLDVNDNRPVFNCGACIFPILETDSLSDLFQLRAEDRDYLENGTVSYRIVFPSNIPFTIDQTTGVISNTQKIDFETKSVYHLEIEATDNALGDPNYSRTMIEIQVLDRNDNYPTVISELNFDVSENHIDYATPIGVIEATDRESGNQLTYNILKQINFPYNPNLDKDCNWTDWKSRRYSPSNQTIIHINDEGRIYLREPHKFDREESVRYEFDVYITDNGRPALSSVKKLVLSIQDANDNVPLFEDLNKKLTVKSDTKKGDVIGQVKANDRDCGLNGKVKYRVAKLSSNLSLNLIDVNEDSGLLYLTKDLSYILPSNFHEKYYPITIQASDSGPGTRTSTYNLAITIVDGSIKSKRSRIDLIKTSTFLKDDLDPGMSSTLALFFVFILSILIIITTLTILYVKWRKGKKENFEFTQSKNYNNDLITSQSPRHEINNYLAHEQKKVLYGNYSSIDRRTNTSFGYVPYTIPTYCGSDVSTLYNQQIETISKRQKNSPQDQFSNYNYLILSPSSQECLGNQIGENISMNGLCILTESQILAQNNSSKDELLMNKV